MIRCYIIDDESAAIELLKDYIAKTPNLLLVGSSQNPLTALDEITGPDAPDITFIDIDMRQLSGLELAGMINLYTTVIFTTAFPQYALQAFEKEGFDYLLKPITYTRFIGCIQHYKRKQRKGSVSRMLSTDDFLNIQSGVKGRMLKVQLNDILYIEGAVNYIKIITAKEHHVTYLTLKDIEKYLPLTFFARVHRSFIINIRYVKIIERNRLKLANDIEIMMGSYYKQRFLDIMDDYMVKTSRAS